MSEGFKLLSTPHKNTNLAFLRLLDLWGFIPISKAPILPVSLWRMLIPFHPLSLFKTGEFFAIYLIAL